MPWTVKDVDRHRKGLSRKQKKKWVAIANGALASCMEGGGKDCEGRAVRIANSKFEDSTPFNPVIDPEKAKEMKKEVESKKFQQHKKTTPPDPYDGHTHEAAFDEDGNGATDQSGNPPHTHQVWSFKVQPYYYGDYASVHPGSLAFAELGECEMEIFRTGTHNGDEFAESDLEEIAANFKKLKGELRPKLKLTHRENQETLAGLASYGDVVDVFLKQVADGTKRLFAKVANIPKQILDWIKERRFPDRSIELYPEFRLGTKENSPVYKNVLKAIALLGHEMPAVAGMEAVKLEECLECQNTLRFVQSFDDDEPAPKELEMAFKIAGDRLTKTREEVRK